MAEHELMQAIGRLERAVSRLEKAPTSVSLRADAGLIEKHAALKNATAEAIQQIDALLAAKGGSHG